MISNLSQKWCCYMMNTFLIHYSCYIIDLSLHTYLLSYLLNTLFICMTRVSIQGLFSDRDCNPGFEKPGARGNLDILPTPKPGFQQSAKPAGFGFAFLHQSASFNGIYHIRYQQTRF